MRTRANHVTLAGQIILLFAFTALAGVYSAAFPLLEGSDEAAHFVMVDEYSRTGQLPDLRAPQSHEATQTPLYYALSAFAISGTQRGDVRASIQGNPEVGNGFYIAIRANNAETWAPGMVAAIRIARVLNILFGAITLALMGATTGLIFRRTELTLFVVALAALNPRFILMCATVTNDAAVACLCALVCFLATRVAAKGPRAIGKAGLMLGAACGLATLAKLSGIAFGAAAIAGIAIAAARQPASGRVMRLLRLTAGAALGWLAVAGWYFVHNFILYGDPMAWERVSEINAGFRGPTMTFAQFAKSWPIMISTYWGSFGYGAGLPDDVDRALAIVTVVGIAGLGIGLARRQIRPLFAVPVAGFAALFVAFTFWARDYGVSTRLLFPGALPMAMALGTGLLAWAPLRLRAGLAATLGLSLFGLAVATPFTVLLPAYRPPVALPTAEADALDRSGQVTFDNGMRLVRVELLSNRVNPGDAAQVRLYWTTVRTLDRAWQQIIEARTSQGATVGRESGPPFGGRLNTRDWRPGEVLVDDIRIRLAGGPYDPPAIVTLFVGVAGHNPPHDVARLIGSGASSASVGQLRIRVPQVGAQSQVPTLATFGRAIRLESAARDDGRLILTLAANGEPQRPLTIFAHARDARGALIGQQDQPLEPSPALWIAGDRYRVTLAQPAFADAASIAIGVYDPATRAREPAFGASGARLPDDLAVWP